MNFDKKRTIPRYSAIIIILATVGAAIVGKAGYEMYFRFFPHFFAEKRPF